MEPKKKLFVLSILTLTAAYLLLALLSSEMGVVGDLLRHQALRAFGLGAYVLPFLLGFVVYELAVLHPARKYRFVGRITGVFLWSFCVPCPF